MALSMRSHQIIYLQPVHQCKELYHKCKYCKNNALYWIDLKWLWLFPQPLHSLNVCRCSSMHPFLNFPFHLYHFWLHNSHLFYSISIFLSFHHWPLFNLLSVSPVSTHHSPGFVLPVLSLYKSTFVYVIYMHITNSRGPSTDISRIPLITILQPEYQPSATTCCLLSVSQFGIQTTKSP